MGRLRVFARFQSKEEHEALVEGLLRAGKLRQQIELYRTYRQMGVRTLEQAKQYEANKRLREKDAKARKQKDRESAPYLLQSSTAASQQSASSSQQQSQGEFYDDFAGKLTGRRRGRDSSSSSLQEDGINAAASNGRKSFRGSSGALDSMAESAPATTGAGAGPYYNRGSGEQAVTGAWQEDPAVIARAPGGDLLSDLEIHLCSQVPMLPLHYLAAKDTLVRCACSQHCYRTLFHDEPVFYLCFKPFREAYRNGSLTQDGVKRLLKVL